MRKLLQAHKVKVFILSVYEIDNLYRVNFGIKLNGCLSYYGLFIYHYDFKDIKLYEYLKNNLYSWKFLKFTTVYDPKFYIYRNKKFDFKFRIKNNSNYSIDECNQFDEKLVFIGSFDNNTIVPYIDYRLRKHKKKFKPSFSIKLFK